MKVYKAPEDYPLEGLKVFLAGSIEMGKAEDWQTELTNALDGLDVTILTFIKFNSNYFLKLNNLTIPFKLRTSIGMNYLSTCWVLYKG
jgi:succinylglutamate desuccinylase